MNFGTPLGKNISLKHQKLPKNHFKTNFSFIQLKHLKSTFTFGEKNENIDFPPLLSKSPNFDFFGLFPLFVTFFNSNASLREAFQKNLIWLFLMQIRFCHSVGRQNQIYLVQPHPTLGFGYISHFKWFTPRHHAKKAF